MTKPSKLPWKVEENGEIRIYCNKYEVARASDLPSSLHCLDAEDNGYGEQKANAKLIVKCVNAHYKLKEELRNIRALLRHVSSTRMMSIIVIDERIDKINKVLSTIEEN